MLVIYFLYIGVLVIYFLYVDWIMLDSNNKLLSFISPMQLGIRKPQPGPSRNLCIQLCPCRQLVPSVVAPAVGV